MELRIEYKKCISWSFKCMVAGVCACINFGNALFAFFANSNSELQILLSFFSPLLCACNFFLTFLGMKKRNLEMCCQNNTKQKHKVTLFFFKLLKNQE